MDVGGCNALHNSEHLPERSPGREGGRAGETQEEKGMAIWTQRPGTRRGETEKAAPIMPGVSPPRTRSAKGWTERA